MPTGQIALQARQSKQAYICSIRLEPIASSPSSPLRASATRPRGEADLAQVFPVGWADRQAQPAADAIQVLFFGWLGI